MVEEVRVVEIWYVMEDRAAAEEFARYQRGAKVEELSGSPPRWRVVYYVPEDMLTEAFLGGSPPQS